MEESGRFLHRSYILLDFREGNGAVGQRVLFGFVHLGIGLAFILEDGIPACIGSSVNILLFNGRKENADAPKLVGPRAGTILPCSIVITNTNQKASEAGSR